MGDYRYFEMLVDDRVYAICRTRGALVERWSPDRQRWKEAVFHVGELLFNEGARERREVSQSEAEMSIQDGPLEDINDEDWAHLSENR